MMPMRKILPLGLALMMLGGCSTINSLTGQTDDTVLPGKREEAIPGRAQFPDQPDPLVKPSGAAQPAAPSGAASPGTQESACKKDDPDCKPASDDGVFSDPQ